MSDDALDDLFSDSTIASTPQVARFADISESRARALAAEIGVGRAGPAYAWQRDDVTELLDLLAEEDPDEGEEEDDEPGDPDEEEGEDTDSEEEDE